ncbi:Acyl-CoA N-acyltransferases (Nat) [Glarea lozoyensis ATCC 20868]|uniref:Acyl-CoA N-acyltransferases (Nat) n=1 Tax=Glarea lozoyensis (strain ATCC 20868 / MF5171) TaxID=1116229 RepID=S3D8G6_GLAL2|nr:Acyl-CoA N-acyltransferases (Nat) [Glarea lozoyensis ATCC 20868]EPE28276.1 Acyl-CoA N-acyltransferases (Nat) [Glarea lozoyensis ATCC 20868]
MASSNSNFKILSQPPVGKTLLKYDIKQHPQSQSLEIPPVFIAAVQAREDVFVAMYDELTFENNLDYDDPRSIHFVAFSNTPDEEDIEPNSITDIQTRNKFVLRAIGTLRFIPFPQYHQHPPPGMVFDADSLRASAAVENSAELFLGIPEYKPDRPTKFHDGIEAYIKVGRMCVIKEWRGKGVMDELLRTGYKWLTENKGWTTGTIGGEERFGGWKGLICAHADINAKRSWERNGFVVDEDMGCWWILGIQHICMWKRIELD